MEALITVFDMVDLSRFCARDKTRIDSFQIAFTNKKQLIETWQ